MKLITTTGTYISPNPTQGEFPAAFIEDARIISVREKNQLEVTFDLAYYRDSKQVVIASAQLVFFGNEEDTLSSNRTTFMKYPNPDFDASVEGSEEFLSVPLMDYLQQNAGIYPPGYEIIDYGFPTFEKALEYFTGGSLANPEIFIAEDPLAQNWLLNTLSFYGEPVGKQFQFEAVT